ncbi:MAG: Rdx family protein [Candidatus Dormibacteraeota bacterium]|nr:Rdx family protein [Candidatus Dormibacteraeota bacterium]
MRAAADIMDGWAPILVGIELRTGSRGAFEVALDGETVFSKKQEKRFPQETELRSLIETRLGPTLQWRSPG